MSQVQSGIEMMQIFSPSRRPPSHFADNVTSLIDNPSRSAPEVGGILINQPEEEEEESSIMSMNFTTSPWLPFSSSLTSGLLPRSQSDGSRRPRLPSPEHCQRRLVEAISALRKARDVEVAAVSFLKEAIVLALTIAELVEVCFYRNRSQDIL